MRKLLLLFGLLLALTPAQAADNALIVTPGVGVTMRTIDDGGAHQIGTSVPVGVNGVSAWGTAGVANANILSVQGIASMTPLLVTATQSGTWNIGTVTTLTTVTNPVAATQSGTWTVQPGNTANTTAWLVNGTGGVFPSSQSGNWTMRNVGNAGAILDFAGQNVASPANAFLIGGQFNTTPTTITTGNASPLQLDNAGNLLVNVKAGGAAGGTSSSFGSTFPATGTATGFTDGTNMVAGRVTTYGTAPTGFNALAVNAFVTNANANGQTTMSASSPVTIASNQTAYPVNIAATTTGGSTITSGNNIAANNTTAVVIKASAGTVYGVQLGGIGSAPAYLKLYNATSATCGSGTPVKRFIIPAAATAANGAGSNITFGPQGLAFTTGITYCVTTGITDADTTAPAASTYLINVDWN